MCKTEDKNGQQVEPSAKGGPQNGETPPKPPKRSTSSLSDASSSGSIHTPDIPSPCSRCSTRRSSTSSMDSLPLDLPKPGLISDLWSTQLNLWTIAFSTLFTFLHQRHYNMKSCLLSACALTVVSWVAWVLGMLVVGAHLLQMDFLSSYVRQKVGQVEEFGSRQRRPSGTQQRMLEASGRVYVAERASFYHRISSASASGAMGRRLANGGWEL